MNLFINTNTGRKMSSTSSTESVELVDNIITKLKKGKAAQQAWKHSLTAASII